MPTLQLATMPARSTTTSGRDNYDDNHDNDDNNDLSNWLDKNKDPINDTVVDQMKKSTNALTVYLFRDHPGQPEETVKEEKKKGKGKEVRHKTVSSFFRAQLDALLTTLNTTDPHFIRCIIPNNHKTPGLLDSGLVMHQVREHSFITYEFLSLC